MAMAFSFLNKKKRYKFGVQVCLEELTQVPYLREVFFAKLRVEEQNFLEYSSREEVRDHAVRWNAQFSFVCKMCANANTGVLEPARMRVSIRMECKGGRSYQKLGFCVVDLAEHAGAGETTLRCLLEGYDKNSRLHNSMLRLTIKMNMMSGDPLFKVGSENATRAPDDDCASSTTSSGFGSLTKKNNYEGAVPPALPTPAASDPSPDEEERPLPPDHLVEWLSGTGGVAASAAGAASAASAAGAGVAGAGAACASCLQHQQHTHSRNSSNTSGDMSSKASGYGSSVSAASAHSRQSSEGECAADPARAHHHSGRGARLAKLVLLDGADVFLTPDTTLTAAPDLVPDSDPRSPPLDEYQTPDSTLVENSFSMPTYFDQKKRAAASVEKPAVEPLTNFQIFKQKSLNTIPALIEKSRRNEELFNNFPFLTPLAHRKNSVASESGQLPGCFVDEPCRGCGASTPAPRARPHTVALPGCRNPSSGSASASESGSLERARAALERRKRAQPHPQQPEDHQHLVSCRVENTRVNPNSLIDELLATTNLHQPVDDAAETSGLQLFISRDGTAELGSRQRQLTRTDYRRVVVHPTDNR